MLAFYIVYSVLCQCSHCHSARRKHQSDPLIHCKLPPITKPSYNIGSSKWFQIGVKSQQNHKVVLNMHALQTGFSTIFMSVIKRHCVEAQPQLMGSETERSTWETGQTALLLFNSLDSSVAHCPLLSLYKQVESFLKLVILKSKKILFPSISLTHSPANANRPSVFTA